MRWPQSERRRRRWYFALMGVCVVLILLAWNLVRLWSPTAALAMSVAAGSAPTDRHGHRQLGRGPLTPGVAIVRCRDAGRRATRLTTGLDSLRDAVILLDSVFRRLPASLEFALACR